MAEDLIKLPWIKLEIPKPKPWDLAALLFLGVAIVVAGVNLSLALNRPGGSAISGTMTGLFVLGQLAITSGALLILGKTAKAGTIWGNLAALGGMLAGMSGVLLAAALWSAA